MRSGGDDSLREVVKEHVRMRFLARDGIIHVWRERSL